MPDGGPDGGARLHDGLGEHVHGGGGAEGVPRHVEVPGDGGEVGGHGARPHEVSVGEGEVVGVGVALFLYVHQAKKDIFNR